MISWEERIRRQEDWERKLGTSVEIEGIALNAKLGAVIEDLWIDGLEGWPEDWVGQRVRVSGILIRREDVPVFRANPDESPRAGIPVPEGIDLEKARRRYLLTKAQWVKASP